MRYEKGQATGRVSDVKQKKKGRPPKPTNKCGSTSPSIYCIGRQNFDNDKCVICQEDRADQVHDVSTKNMRAQLRAIGQQTTNEQLKVRLSNVVVLSDRLAAVAEHMKYHLQCLVLAKRDIKKGKEQFSKDHIKLAQLVSDVEILSMVEREINDSTNECVLNMNDIETSYLCLLETNGFILPEFPRYKRYLKQQILDNIKMLMFTSPDL